MLSVRALHAGYGSLEALHGVDIDVERGARVALLGHNGAGKTTLLQTIAGFGDWARGDIEFDGHSLLGERPWRIARRGVVLVPEGRRIFVDLSTIENLQVAAYASSESFYRAHLEEVTTLFPQLAARLATPAALLSGGEQQMLALARALMRGPRLMLIDELSLGVGPLVMQRIYDALRSYSETGVTIVFVEQNVRQALDFADHAYIMNAGRVVASGPAEAFRAESDLAALLVGAGFTREEASGEESYDATPTEQLSEVTSHEPQEA